MWESQAAFWADFSKRLREATRFVAFRRRGISTAFRRARVRLVALIAALIADRAPHHRVVLLLDKTTVVFAIRTRAREGDLLFLTVGKERLIDELRAVVTINAQQRKGQFGSDLLQSGEAPYLR